MVLEKLGESLRETLRKVSSSLFVDDKLINELIKDLQRALLQSDVNVKLVFSLTNRIKQRIKDEKTPAQLSKKDHLVHVLYEELGAFLGSQAPPLEITGKPHIILLVGLFGNGKTTTTAKLAKYYQKRGKKVSLISTDTWRPAAFEQLQQLGAQINVPVYGNPKIKDPVKIFNSFTEKFTGADVVIVDTAGRDALNEELIDEIKRLAKTVQANDVFLVMGADLGQAAQQQAEAFHASAGVTGVIITRMDGTARGVGALAACAVTGAPVRFIGVGEKIDEFEEFKPVNFVGRLLGMGDLEGLLEKTKDAFSEKDMEDLSKRLLKGEFTLIDLYEQMQSLKKMGPLTKVMEMIPGFSQVKLPKEALEVQQEKMEIWRHVMDSCTQEELEDPTIITGSRAERIAKGSGTSPNDVRDLVKQYKQAQKMMKMLKGGDEKHLEKLMKKMGGRMKM